MVSYDNQTCITTDVTPQLLQAVQNFSDAVNGSIVFDLVMLDSASPDWAVDLANAIDSTVGWDRVLALEIGNEQDLFTENGIRSPNYTVGDFERETNMYLAALALPNGTKADRADRANGAGSPSMPRDRPMLQGGTLCCKTDFVSATSDLIDAWKDKLVSWSYHRCEFTTHTPCSMPMWVTGHGTQITACL